MKGSTKLETNGGETIFIAPSFIVGTDRTPGLYIERVLPPRGHLTRAEARKLVKAIETALKSRRY